MGTCLRPPCVDHLHTQQFKHGLASLHLVTILQVASSSHLEGMIAARDVDLLVVVTAADDSSTSVTSCVWWFTCPCLLEDQTMMSMLSSA